MDNLCQVIVCIGVVISLGLLIGILVKQNKCCSNNEKYSPCCSPATQYGNAMYEYGLAIGKGQGPRPPMPINYACQSGDSTCCLSTTQYGDAMYEYGLTIGKGKGPRPPAPVNKACM